MEMTNNKMTPEQFVKEWLPDFNQKRKAWENECQKAGVTGVLDNWIKVNFPEAIEAFARHVHYHACRDQRADCYDKALEEFANPNGYSVHSICHAIQNTPAPEFKLTENTNRKI